MANILEMLMLICFGASWPINLKKALQTGTAKGTSLVFLCLIEFGYVCGIGAKILHDNINYVLFFYILNLVVVAANIIIYFINRQKDKRNGVS